MNHLSIIRRHLCILRQVQPPFLYPDKRKMLKILEEEDLGNSSARTYERDIQDIELYYGIKVRYCKKNKGYHLDQATDEDISEFTQFFRLLERSEHLAFLTHSADVLSTGKYLLLEDNQDSLSTDHLEVIWTALRSRRQLTFKYQPFGSDTSKIYQVDPLVLLEYRNRWYLAIWDPQDSKIKTLGLERMQKPELTDTPIEEDRRSQFITLKKNALGVYVSPEDLVEEVILKVQAAMIPYILTVPIHSSQTILKQHQDSLLINLKLIINPELEREILGYGEHVEILKPDHLREKIRTRTEKLLENYIKINSTY